MVVVGLSETYDREYRGRSKPPLKDPQEAYENKCTSGRVQRPSACL